MFGIHAITSMPVLIPVLGAAVALGGLIPILAGIGIIAGLVGLGAGLTLYNTGTRGTDLSGRKLNNREANLRKNVGSEMAASSIMNISALTTSLILYNNANKPILPNNTSSNNNDQNSKKVEAIANEYEGVKEASEFLKSQNVPHKYRKQILESFEIRTIKMETASDSTYGIRFYGGAAEEKGRYLFETFSSTTNRNNLALPYEFNTMTGLQQFKVENGTQMITGIAAPQFQYGSQYVGGAHQWYINSLEALTK